VENNMRRNRNKKQNLPNEEKTETAIDIGDRLIETRLCRQSNSQARSTRFEVKWAM
jgi:hypothetical protein